MSNVPKQQKGQNLFQQTWNAHEDELAVQLERVHQEAPLHWSPFVFPDNFPQTLLIGWQARQEISNPLHSTSCHLLRMFPLTFWFNFDIYTKIFPMCTPASKLRLQDKRYAVPSSVCHNKWIKLTIQSCNVCLEMVGPMSVGPFRIFCHLLKRDLAQANRGCWWMRL